MAKEYRRVVVNLPTRVTLEVSRSEDGEVEIERLVGRDQLQPGICLEDVVNVLDPEDWLALEKEPAR